MNSTSRVEKSQGALDEAWMARLFPNKDSEKRAKWLNMMHNTAKPATLRALVKLEDQAWKQIGASPSPPGRLCHMHKDVQD